jgi:DNA polymerase phi
MPLLNKALLGIVTDCCADKTSLTAVQLKEVFKLALLAVRQTKRISPTSTQSIWQPQSWTALQQALKVSRFKTSPALQKMCEHIIRTSEVAGGDSSSKSSKSVTSKRKVEEVGTDEVASPVTKKSKRKKSKE